jgi:pyruvate kinase
MALDTRNPTALMATKAADHFELPGKIAWLASLDTSAKPAKEFRRTSIICTIGPKTNSVEAIAALRRAGLNGGWPRRACLGITTC